MAANSRPGAEAVRIKGWFKAHKWLLLRARWLKNVANV